MLIWSLLSVRFALRRRLNGQPLAVGMEGLCLELDQKRHDLATGPLDQDGAILPRAIQMLKLPQWIALVEVNVMHAQITGVRRAKDEDAHASKELRLQRVECIVAYAVNPWVA